ncbi:MAG: SDR family NAD(P)-dependent oxidoreductase, partial [Ectothiorhodospiraceae bacterium]|nr:SDR family NAD(P)-dependent oxidoreductase [Ectothiorhodospiraceae bacterium]
RAGGTYLVTGGLGGIGRALARHLVTDLAARVVLVGRTALPAEHEWDDWLGAHAEDDPVARRIRVVRELRGRGGQVEVLAADVADRAAMERVFASVAERFGALDGVIHAAGVPGAGLIALKTAEVAEAVLRPKVEGTLVLAELAARAGAGFLLLCSSQTAVKGAAGQVDYTAANAFQDAFALGRRGDRVPRVVAVNWDTWREGGMAVDTVLPAEYAATRSSRLALGLSDDEGWEVTRRVLATGWPQVLVSTCEFPPPAAAAPALEPPDDASEAAATPGGHERPELEADYVAPSGPVETAVAALWGALFGIDRVGANDDFFELGGHSLLATQLVNRLKQEFPDAVLSLRALYDSPTVAGLAARIAAAAPAPRAAPRTRLAAAVPSERAAILAEYVREQAAEAAGAAVPADDDLRALDLSTLVPGLIWAFKRDLELSVYPREILRDPSVGAIAEILRRALFDTGGHSTGADTRAGGSAASARSRAPVAVAVSERLPAAAFVLSAPRSGSTLLRLMLSRHRGLFSPPELGLMNVASAGEWLGALGRVVDVDGLGRDLAALARLDPATCVSELRALARDDAPVERVYRTLQRWAGERLLVDKTPSYAMNAAVLERADAMFDGARFVHLVRHPYAMIESFVRHRMAHLLEDDPGDPQAVAEHWWTTCNENLVALADRLGPQRVHRVRYEDLVREPEPVMREMCRFLDVEFDPAVLDPYARGAVIGGVGDPDILQHDGVDPRLADAWERVELARPVDPRTAALAARFDYTLPGNDSDAGSDDALLARLDRMSAEEIDALFQQTFDGSGDDDRR